MAAYSASFQRSIAQPEAFWREKAARMDWFHPPAEILSPADAGWQTWYRGGKLNSAYLALDHQISQGRGDQQALIYDSPVTQTRASFTFRQLSHDP